MNHTLCRRNRILVVVAVAALLAGIGGAGISHADEDGGQAGASMRWGVGARPVAMGGAYAGVADGPTGFWWNPAGITQVRNNQLEVSWRGMGFDRQAGYVTFLHPFGRDDAAMQLSWTYSGVSDLYEYDIDGVRGNKLSNFTNAGTFSFARRFTPVLAIGINMRYIQQNIANINAYTIGFDVGLHLQFVRDWHWGGMRIPMSKVRIGSVVQQINQKYPWTTSDYWIQFGESGRDVDEKFPLIFRNGISAFLYEDKVLVSVDTEIGESQNIRFHAGAEVRPYPAMALRGGLDDTQPTFGAGWLVKVDQAIKLSVDYAYSGQRGAINAEHVFSLGARF